MPSSVSDIPPRSRMSYLPNSPALRRLSVAISAITDKFTPYLHTMAATIIPTLGTGLFIGTGQALAAGGPASLLGSYLFISLLVYCLTTALAEVATQVPFPDGTMITHTFRYASNHLGFSLCYLRWYTLAMLVPFEITTAMVNLGLWQPGAKIALRMSIVTIVICGFNMLPEKIFKRSEVIFTILKFITTTSLIITSLYLAIRGIPGTPIQGFHYWRQPGPFKEHIFRGDLGRLFGFVQSLLCSTISFILIPELTVQRAEQLDSELGPSVFKRARNNNILLFVLYVLSAFSTTLMSPYNDPSLTNNGAGAGLSPYIVGIKKANIKTLPTVVTALIFLSSVASARSFLYTASRMLSTLAETGQAPEIFKTRNRWGVPYLAIATSASFSGFAYLSMVTSSSMVFNYLMFFITTSGYISWACSSVIYLRFRRTASALGPLPAHRSYIQPPQPFGAYFSLLCSLLLPIGNALQVYSVSQPQQFNPKNAIPSFIGIIIFALLYVGHRIATSRSSSANPNPPQVTSGSEMVETRNSKQPETEPQTLRSDGERSTASTEVSPGTPESS